MPSFIRVYNPQLWHTTTGHSQIKSRFNDFSGVENLLRPKEGCFAYFERSAESLRLALQDLESYVNSEGPFDAVMGFSEGASIAASYIASKRDESNANLLFKCALFICAVDVWDPRGPGKVLKASDLGEFIPIPAANIMGSQDQYYTSSLDLSQACDARTREILDHEGGHEIPRGPKITTEMANMINVIIDRALLAQ